MPNQQVVNCLRIEDVQRFLDENDDRRLRSTEIRNTFSSPRHPSFYPGYTAEDLDDGRLDRQRESGFVPVDEVQWPGEEEDAGDDDDEFVWNPRGKELAAPVRRDTMTSSQSYASIYYHKLPSLKTVWIRRRRGLPLEPYTPITRGIESRPREA